MRFYILEYIVGVDAETAFDSVGKVKRGEAPVCPDCGSYAGMIPWLPPYRVSLQAYGTALGDIAFGVSNNLLLSTSFLAAWRSMELSGFESVEPVHIVSIRPGRYAKNPERYWFAAPPPASARIDRERSVIIRPKPDCSRCGAPGPTGAILKLRIDERSWNGDDIFVAWGSSRLFVTERVVELARDFGLRNVTTIPIEEFRWDPLKKYPLNSEGSG